MNLTGHCSNLERRSHIISVLSTEFVNSCEEMLKVCRILVLVDRCSYYVMCVNIFLYTHTHMPYMVYSFVFAIFPSVKTFVSRLEQTPGDVSEQRRI